MNNEMEQNVPSAVTVSQLKAKNTMALFQSTIVNFSISMLEESLTV